jgi:hypothetical protein
LFRGGEVRRVENKDTTGSVFANETATARQATKEVVERPWGSQLVLNFIPHGGDQFVEFYFGGLGKN